MRPALIRFILLLFLIILANEVAMTCPVCFGAVESARTRDSLNMAVIVLLGITGGVLSLFVTFFAYLRKRARMTLNGSFEYPNPN
jgi:heme/copper-type cytochrome/quinol oxidase subunit 2